MEKRCFAKNQNYKKFYKKTYEYRFYTSRFFPNVFLIKKDYFSYPISRWKIDLPQNPFTDQLEVPSELYNQTIQAQKNDPKIANIITQVYIDESGIFQIIKFKDQPTLFDFAHPKGIQQISGVRLIHLFLLLIPFGKRFDLSIMIYITEMF